MTWLRGEFSIQAVWPCFFAEAGLELKETSKFVKNCFWTRKGSEAKKIISGKRRIFISEKQKSIHHRLEIRLSSGIYQLLLAACCKCIEDLYNVFKLWVAETRPEVASKVLFWALWVVKHYINIFSLQNIVQPWRNSFHFSVWHRRRLIAQQNAECSTSKVSVLMERCDVKLLR